MVAQVCVGKAPTFDGRKEFSAIPFHRESPVSPNWTGNFDAVGDVKQCVYCERTRRQSLRVILIVIPVFECFESAQIVRILYIWFSLRSRGAAIYLC